MSMWADLLGLLLLVLVAIDADCWLELVTKEGAGEACPPSTDCSSWAGCWTGSGWWSHHRGLTSAPGLGSQERIPCSSLGAPPVPDSVQVWSLTQSYSVDFSQSRIGVKKVCFQQTHNQGLRQLLLTVSWDLCSVVPEATHEASRGSDDGDEGVAGRNGRE